MEELPTHDDHVLTQQEQLSLVYSGRAGKSFYDQKGGGVNYQCLPNNPEYGQYAPGVQNFASIYGVEYQLNGGSPLPVQTNHNVPCAVCHVSTRAAVLMIPAWRHCPSQWTLEYTGYLMTEAYNHGKATYECVDKDAESVPGSNGDTIMEDCSTMLKQTAMDYHVHLMILRRSSPVLCVPSEHYVHNAL